MEFRSFELSQEFSSLRVRAAAVAVLALLATSAIARGESWAAARIEPRIDNLDALLEGCAQRRAPLDAWLEHRETLGAAAPALEGLDDSAPECSATALQTRLAARAPGVSAIA